MKATVGESLEFFKIHLRVKFEFNNQLKIIPDYIKIWNYVLL